MVTDGKGHEADARLGKNGLYELGILATHAIEPGFPVVLFPALTKGDGFEWLIEKGVEMGVTRIVPLLTERCVVRPPSEDRLERWRKIAVASMLQCGSCIKPSVESPVGISCLPGSRECATAVVLHEALDGRNSTPFHLLPHPSELSIASGPEGGFTDSEVATFQKIGWLPLWLGNRRFRAETAPLVALASLLVKPLA